jgi:hypothetical protein
MIAQQNGGTLVLTKEAMENYPSDAVSVLGIDADKTTGNITFTARRG